MINFKEWATILPTDVNGFQVIKIIKGFFKDIEYTYGSVAFEEGVDDVTLKFEYTIRTGELVSIHEESFRQLSGELLFALLEDQLEDSKIVYSGGID